MPPRRVYLALGLAAALAACADPRERSTTWGYLHASILEPSCATANCHSSVVQQGGPAIGPLDLSTPERAYTALTGIDFEDTSCKDADGNPKLCNECRDHLPYYLGDSRDPLIPPGFYSTDDFTWLAREHGKPALPGNVDGVTRDPDYPLMQILNGVPWCPDPDIHLTDSRGMPSIGFDYCPRASEEQVAALMAANAPILQTAATEIQMPPDNPLAPGEIRLIREWIKEGAPCD